MNPRSTTNRPYEYLGDTDTMPATDSLLQQALALHKAGNLAQADLLYEKILRLDPQHADALHLSGVAAHQRGEHQRAVEQIRRAVALRPNDSTFHCNLGSALQAIGDLDQACAHLTRALELDPQSAEIHFNLGNAFKQAGQTDAAITHYRQALQQRPEYPQALNNLGNTLADRGDLEEAVDCLREAIRLRPDFADPHHNLGNTLTRQERQDEARPHFAQAPLLAHKNPKFLESYFLSLSYDVATNPEERFALHRHWGELVREPVEEQGKFTNSPDFQRQLRIGYVSPDFRDHAVARFFLPLLRNHTRTEFEVTCYAEVEHPDASTAALRNLADRWRSTTGHSDEQIARIIRDDGIDILVDLAGHTANHRLGVFAHQPAPIQVTGIGYGWTTGLDCVHYRLTDRIADPPGEPVRHTEELIRLDSGILCYEPPDSAPEVSELPALQNGFMTFGAFHRHVKLNARILSLWAEILTRIPTARLLLKDRAFRLPAVVEKYSALCREFGIPDDRLTLAAGSESSVEHLACYSNIDIALDTLPYNGSTTTCEALWMGVPVISLRGDSYVGRMSASLLTQVGLEEDIARTPEEYIERAVQAARDPDRLAELRKGLRDQFRRSPVCDGARYTGDLERAFRSMWQKWCGDQKTATPEEGIATPDLLDAAMQFQQAGDHNQAALLYRRVLNETPDCAEIHNNLGIALRAEGNLNEAVNCYRRAIELSADFFAAHNNLGNALWEQGRMDDALKSLRHATQLNPGSASTWCTIGLILRQMGDLTGAILAFQQALHLSPEFAEAHNSLGMTLQDQGKILSAVESYRAALEIKPDFVSAHVNLGNALSALHRFEESCLYYRRAIDITPDYCAAHSNLLMVMQYDPHFDAEKLYAAHRQWGEKVAVGQALSGSLTNDHHGQAPSASIKQPACTLGVTTTHADKNYLDPQRRLRIGYVSPDFRKHSVAHFIEPILRQHDPQAVETFCYSQVERPDEITVRLKAVADHWRQTVDQGDEQVAEMIRRDEIDILVDLAGHTSGNRLGVFARKPAPIQICYLGYGNTTGLNTVDYWLTDAVANPSGEPVRHSEELVRLQHGILCYAPPSDTPPVAPLPATERGYLTFGSFNRWIKINPGVVRLWARILNQLPTARLLLKDRAYTDQEMREFVEAEFGKHGIEPSRIALVPRTATLDEHLELYRGIDVALDPFPYNGSTTTCEALWMGVPVLTLRGSCYVGRMASSLLTQIGLNNFIAESPDDYVERALLLNDQIDSLATLRGQLRQRLTDSPICDANGYTRELETVYRTLWQRRCAS